MGSSLCSLCLNRKERDIEKMLKAAFVLTLCFSLAMARPSINRPSLNALETHFDRIIRAACKGQNTEIINCSRYIKNLPKIKTLKKSVYNYLEAKLVHLNKSQQLQVANALISKLFHLRRSLINKVPRRNSEDMFARML